MNYLTEINAFYDWLLYNPLPTGAIALWYALMSVNNKANWADEFTVANIVLQGMTGLSRQGLDKARNLLTQKGLVQYKKGTSNQAGRYKIVTLDRNKVGTAVVTKKEIENIECKKVDTVVVTKGAQQLSQEGHSSSTLYKLNETKQNETVDDVNPYKFYTSHIGPMLPMVADLIKQYEDTLPGELIIKAMETAVSQNVRKLRYIESILMEWDKQGIKSMDDYKRHEAERASKPQSTQDKQGLTKKLDFNKFPQHEYTEEDLEHIYEKIGGQ